MRYIKFFSSMLICAFCSTNVFAKGPTEFVSLASFKDLSKFSPQFKEIAGSGVKPVGQCQAHEFDTFFVGKKAVGGKSKLIFLRQNNTTGPKLLRGAVLSIEKDDGKVLTAKTGGGDLSEPDRAEISVEVQKASKRLTVKIRKPEALTCAKVQGKTLKEYAQTSDDAAKVFWECGRAGFDGKAVLAQMPNDKPRLWMISSWDINQFEFDKFDIEKGVLEGQIEMITPGFEVIQKGAKPTKKTEFKNIKSFKMKDSKFTEENLEVASGIPCDIRS